MDKSLMQMLGIFLIVAGLVVLGYEGFTYTKHEEVARIGNVQVTADTTERVYISPVYGAISLVAGVVLIVLVRRKGG